MAQPNWEVACLRAGPGQVQGLNPGSGGLTRDTRKGLLHSGRGRLTALHPRALTAFEDNTQGSTTESRHPGLEKATSSGQGGLLTYTVEWFSCSRHCEVSGDRAQPACHPFTVDSPNWFEPAVGHHHAVSQPCDTQHCGAQERRVQPGEPQKGFPGGGAGQNHEIQRVVQTGVENQAPQGELAEARGVEPGGFRNQTPSVFGQSRDLQHIAWWSLLLGKRSM